MKFLRDIWGPLLPASLNARIIAFYGVRLLPVTL